MTRTTKNKTLILAGVLLLTATVAQAGGRCFNAQIPQTMVLPDGSTHAPGLLRICKDRTISPASSLHRSDVEGRSIGMFLGAPRHVEMPVDEGRAQFVFKRTIDDKLVLLGYAVNLSNETTFFDMSRSTDARVANGDSIPDLNGDAEAVVLIAGR